MVTEPVAPLALIRRHHRFDSRPEVIRNHTHSRHRSIVAGQHAKRLCDKGQRLFGSASRYSMCSRNPNDEARRLSVVAEAITTNVVGSHTNRSGSRSVEAATSRDAPNDVEDKHGHRVRAHA